MAAAEIGRENENRREVEVNDSEDKCEMAGLMLFASSHRGRSI
jgi:hypothetical protein